MSVVRCERCFDLIDSDIGLECFTADESGRHGDGPVLCESCREHYYCTSCGERPANCDEDCHHCRAARYISGVESIAQDLEVFPAIWSQPGYARCLALVQAAASAKAAA